MTCRSSVIALLLAALALAGCGSEPHPEQPRKTTADVLARLAAGDAAGVCANLTDAAARELARDFGGRDCTATATAAAGYVKRRKGLQAAVRATVILPNSDTPLSPAPLRAGADTTALRLVIDDPVLGRRQAFDVTLRRIDGRWRIDGGLNALFTLAS